MNPTTSQKECPKCGGVSSGKFCIHCGAPLGSDRCQGCQATLAPGVRFCHACGAPVQGATGAKSIVPLPWMVAAAAVIVAVLVVVVRISAPPPPTAATGPEPTGTPASAPDISSLTPRQQADRLFDMIMSAAQEGDTARVAFHTNMAIQAYAILGELDQDGRYHVGLIHVVRGETEQALAQADSIETAMPGHLLGTILRHTAARANGDSANAQDAYRRFLASYDSENAAQRPEYEMHRSSIDAFLEAARRATQQPGS